MNAAVWTLWLITFANQGGTPAVNGMATFPSQKECFQSMDAITDGIKSAYGKTNTPSPGLMICVYGVPIKR